MTPEVFLFQTTPEVFLFQTTPEVSPKDEVSNMKLIWHGTASVEIISDQNSAPSRILFDPFVPLPGSDVPVKIEDFDGFTDIFVTHGHLDHISDLPEIVRRNPDVKIYCTQAPRDTLLRKGVSSRNIKLLKYNDSVQVGAFRIKALHGKHALLPKGSISRLAYILRSPNRGNIPHIVKEHLRCVEKDQTLFYQIEAEGKTICLMGSLNLRKEVDYPTGADLLVLPYNGWEDNYPPAVRTISRLKPKRVVLDHYDDTFPPITMPLDLQPILRRYREKVTPMKLGTPIDL